MRAFTADVSEREREAAACERAECRTPRVVQRARAAGTGSSEAVPAASEATAPAVTLEVAASPRRATRVLRARAAAAPAECAPTRLSSPLPRRRRRSRSRDRRITSAVIVAAVAPSTSAPLGLCGTRDEFVRLRLSLVIPEVILL